MIVNTKYFGEIEIADEKVIVFSEGILGIEDYKKYALFEMPENEKLTCLQCIDEHRIAFLAINPWDYFPEYDIEVSDEELDAIGIDNVKQLIVFSLISLKEDMMDTTVNLLAPIVINVEGKKALQIVLNENKYNTKHFLFAPEKEVEECLF